MYSFLNQRFLIELLYNKYITGLILSLASQTTKVLDKGSVELIGPFGLEKGLLIVSNNIARLDTGIITTYALYVLIGLLFYVIVPYLSLADNSLLLLILFALFNMFNNVIKPNQKTLVDITYHLKKRKNFYISPCKPQPNHSLPLQSNFLLTAIIGLIGFVFSIVGIILIVRNIIKNNNFIKLLKNFFTLKTFSRVLLCFFFA